MLTGRSVQNIDIFQKPKIKELVLASNNWDDFSDQINKLGNYPENNKTKGDVSELLNHEDLNDLKDHWLSFPENKALDKKHKNMYSCGFKKLIEFF